MNDRFDFILGSRSLEDGRGLEVTPGSYRVVGNNGTHTMNQPIDSGVGATPAELIALMAASDHLPVLVDLQYLPTPRIEVASSVATVSWDALIGTQYTLFQSTDLQGEWTEISAITATTTAISVPIPASGSSVFWYLQIR